jgi:putative ABC transport system permease protein
MGSIETSWQDVRHAVRRLARSPGFAFAAIAILAVGIGANTAVFSVVDSVLLKPLPYAEPERLYAVGEVIPQLAEEFPELPANGRHFLEWQRRCTCFEDAALVANDEWNLTSDGAPERIAGARVTGNFFALLGARAALGRTFVADEAVSGDASAVVISDSLWRRRFGAAPSAIGREVELNGEAHRIVGVLPPSFRHHFTLARWQGLAQQVDVYKPWRIPEEEIDWAGDHNYIAVARLPPGKSPEQALAELNVLQAEIATRFEGDAQAFALLGSLTPLQEQVVASGRAGLLLLLAAVAAVLLIACLNLGNLMLVRVLEGQRELAIRAALGAGRARLLRGALTETLLITLIGAAFGVALAYAAVQGFASVAPADLPRADEVGVDGFALGFAVLLSVAAAALFGGVPALRTLRADPQEALRGTGRSLAGHKGGTRAREWLVAAEVGLSVTLLVVAGLLIVSFFKLDAVERGYDADNLLTAELSLPRGRYADDEARRLFYGELLARIEAQTGIVAAGVAPVLPLQGDAWQDFVSVDGEARPLDRRPVMSYRTVSQDLLRTLGVELSSGRSLRDADYPRRVAVVSQTAADRLWPGEDPIGKRFRRASPTEAPFEVVGVANDVRSAGLDREPPPVLYVPLWERAPEVGSLAVRTRSDPLAAVALLRESVAALDPSVPVSQVRTMLDIERDSTAQRRLQTELVIAFAASALLLAVVGLYSVVAYSASRRQNEIGLRMALGATPGAIRSMVLREGLRPLAIGVAAGVLGAFAIGRLLEAILFSVEARDPLTYLVVTGIILGASLAACAIPARRAARIAPLEALHYD